MDEPKTKLQAAYVDKQKKARTLSRRMKLLVRAWHAYEKAKEKEARLFNQQKSKMQSR